MSMSRSNNQLNQDNQFLIKVVFVGESGVGKTSLLTRQVQDSFTEKFIATIGVDFKIKRYDLGIVKVKAQMWDTAGQQRFRSIQKPYYKNAKAICICFSLDDRKSFERLDHWVNEIMSMEISKENMVLIGCKSDTENIQVATDEILVYAKSLNIPYHQTSARENQGVNEAFQSIMIRAAEQEIASLRNKPLEIRSLKQKQFIEIQDKKVNKKSCC